MVRLAIVSALLALTATPAAAFTIVGDTMTFNEVVHSYGGQTRAEERAAVIRQLERTCASKRKSDIKRCAAAWDIIAAGHRELQARRAAAASAQ